MCHGPFVEAIVERCILTTALKATAVEVLENLLRRLRTRVRVKTRKKRCMAYHLGGSFLLITMRFRSALIYPPCLSSLRITLIIAREA